MSVFTLVKDGDEFEVLSWDLFIKDRFPSYEIFWQKYVVILTNRPKSVYFKSDAELAKIGKSSSDICIAQLNYSVIRHLVRAFYILKLLEKPSGVHEQLDLLIEGMTRLVGAQDNAFELLERFKNPLSYRPFIDSDGKKARETWHNANGRPLQNFRTYRNHLIHGRLAFGIIDNQRLCFPEVGKEQFYRDWRMLTDLKNNPDIHKARFLSTFTIFETAWNETIGFFEKKWQTL